MATTEEVRAALRNVLDPEINRPIEDIGMLENIEVDGGTVRVSVLITIEGCPLKDRIEHLAERSTDLCLAGHGLSLRGCARFPSAGGFPGQD